MSQPLTDYFDALERLKAGRPAVVSKGAKITNDAVAQEAGRGKGSIKKSRIIFADLIIAINLAGEAQAKGANVQKEKLDKAKSSADHYRTELEAALGREVCLLREVYGLKKQLAALTGCNVLPIRG